MHADIVLGQLDKNEALRYMGHRGEDIDEQLDKLKKMSKGDKITVNGKITDVGEVLGYYLDIDSIK